MHSSWGLGTLEFVYPAVQKQSRRLPATASDMEWGGQLALRLS